MEANERLEARAIRTRRDYEKAMQIARELICQTSQEAEKKQRLFSLLIALDRFDEYTDDESARNSAAVRPSGPRRRWTDES